MFRRLLAARPVPLDALNRPFPPRAASGEAAPPPTEQAERRPEPVLLTLDEVAAHLRMSRKSIQRRIKAGKIRKAPTGGRLVRISSDELRRLAFGEPEVGT